MACIKKLYFFIAHIIKSLNVYNQMLLFATSSTGIIMPKIILIYYLCNYFGRLIYKTIYPKKILLSNL